MKSLTALFLVLLATLSGTAHAQQTRPYDVVAEYIRELGAAENARALALKEMSEDNNTMANAIRNSTRAKLELGTSVQALKKMNLKKPFETLLPNTIAFYRQKMALHAETIQIAGAFIAGPKPNVDYAKYAARMPEITASLEFIDKALFESVPLVFALLIDQKADNQNHLSHLLITQAQRQELIAKINGSFGAKLDQSNQNYTVSSASVLRSYLLKEYKCSDDPW